MIRWINFGLVLAIAAPGFGQGDTSSPTAAAKPVQELEKTVSRYSSSVQQKYPAAKLFQVAILGLVPQALNDKKEIDSAIQSWYDIGSKDRYVQAIQEKPGNSEAGPAIAEMTVQTEPCQKPYPTPSSQVCASQPSGVAGPRALLTMRGLSGLDHLSDWIAKAGLDPSDRFDVTITTAGLLEGSLTSSEPTWSSQVSSALRQLKPDELVFSVTDRGAKDQSKTGATIVLNGSTGEMIGRSQPLKRRLAPSLRR